MENRNGSLVSQSLASPKPFKWRVGYWMSSKKSKKFNFDELTELCKSVDIQLVQLNLETDIAPQGHLDAIIHKLSDVIVQADKGDEEATRIIARVEKYVNANPDVVIFDPVPSVRILCDRYMQYSLIHDVCRTDNVNTPRFVDITNCDVQENLAKLKAAGVTFPFICKPLVAHGSSLAHEMSIIFGEHGLKDVKPPCVAQSFVPHNAVLYKVFVIGNRHFICPRPSLKNFHAGDYPTIFFHTHDVSKDGCTSELSEMNDPESPTTPPPNNEKVAAVVRDIRDRTGLALFGLDMIVEKGTHSQYIIDVNALPSYEGVPDFHEQLLQLLSEALNNRDIEVAKRQAHQMSPSRTVSFPSISVAFASSALAPRRSEATSAVITMVADKQTSDLRGQTPPDSGIGSCTESDTSDSEKKRMAAMRIRQQQPQTQTGSMVTTTTATRPVSTCGFTPSWQRIKKFYGIPKPLVLPMLAAGDSNPMAFGGNGGGVSTYRQRQEPTPQTAQQAPANKSMTNTRKPRSQTLP